MRTLLSWLVLALYTFGGVSGAGGNLETADDLFEKHQYQPALEAYVKALGETKGEERQRALLRAAESEALLFRYVEGATRLHRETPPENPVARARLWLLQAELGRQVLLQYGYRLPRESEGKGSDLSRWTSEEWHEEIRSLYRRVWSLRDVLRRIPIDREAGFLELEGADKEAFPTLWDFAAHRGFTYLADEAPAPPVSARPAAQRFVDEDFPTRLGDELTPAEEAAAIAELSAGERGRLASELWRLRRFSLPFEAGVRTAPFRDLKATAPRMIRRLGEWAAGFRHGRAKAEALFLAASLHHRTEELAEAVALCKEVEKAHPKTAGAKQCVALRSEIEIPRLAARAFPVHPGGRDNLEITARNLPKVHYRLYATGTEELKKLRDQYGDDLAFLQHLPQESFSHFLRKGDGDYQGELPITYAAPHRERKARFTLPPLPPGLYALVLSGDRHFEAGRSVMSALVVNATELLLLGTAAFAPAPGFHLYTVDGRTGLPAAGVSVETHLRRQWNQVDRGTVRTDERGRATVGTRFTGEYGYHALSALARRNDDHAFWSTPLTLSHHVPARFTLNLETDRPIYRPGQTLQVKVTVLERLEAGWRTYRGRGSVTLEARDANGKTFHKAVLEPNAFGSASRKIPLPAGSLLGHYSLQATIPEGGKTYSAHHGFTVEEYKRPEFEVTLAEAGGPWVYGRPATVEGSAKYYFGGGVPKAAVTWRITRETYLPWFCWWWRGLSPKPAEEVASGQATADGEGNFRFRFTPRGDEESPEESRRKLPSTFIVEVEARDQGGRTLRAERRYRAGETGALLSVEPDRGFLPPGTAAALPAGLRTLNDGFAEGTGRFQVVTLELPKPFPAPEPEADPTLAQLVDKLPDGRTVAAGEFRARGDGLGELRLPGMPAGLYRLKIEAEDPWGGKPALSLPLVVAGPKAVPALPQAAIAERPKYVAGETARFLLGSGEVTGGILVEVLQGNTLHKVDLLPGGTRLYEVPVTDRLKGGFHVRWFGVTDFRLWSAGTSVDVPWTDRALAVRLKPPPAVAPGEKVRWNLSVEGPDGKPVEGEATVRVYDRSLEYYARDGAHWTAQLYPPAGAPSPRSDSEFTRWATVIPVDTGWLEKTLGILRSLYDDIREPPPPSLRATRSRLSKRRRGMVMQDVARMDAEGGSYAAGPPAEAKLEVAKAAPAKKSDSAPIATSEARVDFSETAHFDPALPVKRGRATVAFRAPERLTSWRVEGAVLTADVRTGRVDAQFATKKDLMVRVETPRFFRLGDEGVLKALVHNETAKAFDAQVQITFNGETHRETVSIAPGAVGEVSWPVRAPASLGVQKVRAIARAGSLVDAEERELALLPSRERLVASQVAYLEGKAKESFRTPNKVTGDEVQSATFQIDPQLALLLLNSVPSLVLYPHACTEQLVNRYVPLAIVSGLFRKYPRLAAAAKAVPRRKTVTPAWDLSDPRRLTALQETPWVNASEGLKSQFPTTDLLDDRLVDKIRRQTLGTLESYQLANGAFPWFPGGRPDPYVTLYVLEAWEQLLRHDLPIPEAAARKAFTYASGAMGAHLKDDPGHVSLLLYGAFVLSAYAERFDWAASGKEQARKYLSHAEQHHRALTPLGLAYAAWVHHRLGNARERDDYLERALGGSRKDKLTGIYWQPEKMSWYWYHDTQEKHAFFLRTLQTLKPKDERLPGLVQWLLFNRKGNEWKSTRASAAALYALVDYFEAKGALAGTDAYRWSWGERREEVRVKGTDWLSAPLRWTWTGKVPLGSPLDLVKTGPGIAIASLTTVWETDRPDDHLPSPEDLMKLERRVFRRVRSGNRFRLERLQPGAEVAVGDQLEVQLVVGSRSAVEYTHLRAPRPAGFEPETLTSGWKWEGLSRYEEVRDSLENFFVDWLPQGEYVLSYRLRATTPGRWRFGATRLQSMYAPEFSAFAGTFPIEVK